MLAFFARIVQSACSFSTAQQMMIPSPIVSDEQAVYIKTLFLPVAGLAAICKGHVTELLRHPQGADVMIDLYDVANTQLRNAMVSAFVPFW